MRARILDKSEEKKWDEFVKKYPTIHQASAWGHFQAKNPTRGAYWIVILEEKGKIIGGSMIIRHGLPKGFCWFYSARGPILDYSKKENPEQIRSIFEALKPLAAKENAIFYRIDPPFPKEKQKKIKGAHLTHLGFQPENSLFLNLEQSEEKILQQMKPKGRYNIRLAEKKGVKIRTADPREPAKFEKDLTTFHKILHETTMRDKFYGHKKAFYRNMIETLYPDNAKLYLAEYEGKIIAGIIATFFEDEAIYYYGASSNTYRNVMAPYLLQWHAIKEAKSRGCRYYDFLGIAPEKAKNHPWQGVTEFKKKFGGTPVDYAAPLDFPFKKFWYWLYRIYKWVKR